MARQRQRLSSKTQGGLTFLDLCDVVEVALGLYLGISRVHGLTRSSGTAASRA